MRKKMVLVAVLSFAAGVSLTMVEVANGRVIRSFDGRSVLIRSKPR